ncbi:MAG: mevalonate kinase [Bacteriovoracia bacterium]
METQVFNSKILLFGEYSIIEGGKGLAIPFPNFCGKLRFPSEAERNHETEESNKELSVFCSFLQELKNNNSLPFSMDLDTLNFDIDQGLFFDSTIPKGQGLGSSGALCAAIYKNYSDQNSIPLLMNDLKMHFALMESHFHGASSGLDPLISYIEKPILLENALNMHEIILRNSAESDEKNFFFLLSTGRPRRTEPLVNLFLEKLNQPKFLKFFNDELIPLNHDCINDFVEGNYGRLIEKFRQLSQYQFDYFLPMIPPLLRKQWEQGLESDDYYLKLCGAGGGGFFLGMCRDLDVLYKKFDRKMIKILFS